MDLTINDLSEEVIKLIFEYLSVQDQKSASLTCRKWLHILDDASFMKNVSFKFSGVDSVSDPHFKFSEVDSVSDLHSVPLFCNKHSVPDLQSLGKLTRKFHIFEFVNITICEEIIDFLRVNAHLVHEISFSRCKFRLENGGISQGIHFENLVSFSLSSKTACCIREFHYVNFGLIVKDAPNLKNLSLKGLMNLEGIGTFPKLQSLKYDVDTNTKNHSDNEESISSCFCNFIYRHAKNLRHLEVSFYQAEKYALTSLSKMSDLQLHSLVVSNLTQRAAVELSELCKKQQSLHSFAAIGSDFSSIEPIVSALPNSVKILKVPSNRIVDGTELFKMTQLHVLDASNSIKNVDYALLSKSDRLLHLRELYLKSAKIENDVIRYLIFHSPELHALDLSFTCVNDQNVADAVTHLRNLKKLWLSCCNNLTIAALDSICKLKNLLDFSFGNSSVAVDELPSFIQFPRLKSLDLRGIVGVNKQMNLRILHQNPCLEEYDTFNLTLSSKEQIEDYKQGHYETVCLGFEFLN